MKNLNKKILIATALFLTPAFALADMQMGDSTMSNGDMMMTNSGVSSDVKFKPMMGSGMFMGSGMTSENKSKMEYLKKSLEEQIKTLRESITPENLEEIKVKAETLKQEYIKKVEELGFPEAKKMIEERFNMFYQNNFTKREDFKKIVDEKKEQFSKMREDKKEQLNNFKQEGKEKTSQIKEEYKAKKEEVKTQFQAKKQDLKTKYKEQFTKTLESKLSLMSAEKIKSVLTKIETAIEKYNSNEKLTQAQKEKFVAQLTAIKELLQDKLDELEGGINIDELLN